MPDHLPYSRGARLPTRYASDVITVTSLTGVGSSTTLGLLQKILGMPWRFVSGGAIMRAFAGRLGMTIDDFAAHNRAHPEEGWDRQADEMLAAFGRQNFTAIEARLGHAFVPQAFHVLLRCNIETRARRRFADTPTDTLEAVRKRMLKRDEDDDRRYEQLYPGCLWVYEDFDFVLDTAEHDPATICNRLLKAHKVWREERQRSLSYGVLYEPAFE